MAQKKVHADAEGITKTLSNPSIYKIRRGGKGTGYHAISVIEDPGVSIVKLLTDEAGALTGLAQVRDSLAGAREINLGKINSTTIFEWLTKPVKGKAKLEEKKAPKKAVKKPVKKPAKKTAEAVTA